MSDSERRDITISVFSEIVIENKTVENYRAKDGFDALLARNRAKGGVMAFQTLVVNPHKRF